MKLYLECSMGASGDMLMAALYELLPDKGAFRERMNRLGLPGVTIEYSASTKCGITGTRVTVKVGGTEEKSEDVHAGSPKNGHTHPHKPNEENSHAHGTNVNHSHKHEANDNNSHIRESGKHDHRQNGRRYGFDEILDLIRGLALPDNVLEDALSVYKIIGEAEASVHGVPLDKIHLHEIGSLDAVTDIVGSCLLINMLGVTEITASPVHVGSGLVRCEHGMLPVPAPAAAEILKGVPIYSSRIKGELCTPTGAALLKRFVKQFGDMAPMTVIRIGYGMGAKDFKAANCLRAFLCESDTAGGGSHDSVFEISCNLDDMAPEAVGAAFELLFDHGALDVYATPIIMKKTRPAIILSCLCTEDARDNLARLMLEHTSTLGVRITQCRRDILSRAVETVSTQFGDIRIKRAHGFGTVKHKPEYDDVLAASKQSGVPFMTVYAAAMSAAE